MSTLAVERLAGTAIQPYLDAVAALRIAVFAEYPYCYDGDRAYEAEYLAAYARSPGSVFVLARDGARLVGAATGIPLADDADAFQAPFRARGFDPRRVYYCGESVLLPEYRGRGLGHRFFDQREAHARALGGYAWIAFAAVDRPADDPRRPPGYRSLEPFWTRRGYVRQDGMTMYLAWKEHGEAAASEKPLTFWLRRLEDAA
jgi:GNAT superfamily N-acetyltransferase